MTLTHPELDFAINTAENQANILAIENPHFLYRFINELNNQIDSADGRFVLSEENDILSVSKNIILITDLFNIDSNQKKILNKIYAGLSSVSHNELYAETAEISAQLERFICRLLANYPSELEYSIPSPDGIIKLFNIRAEESENSLLEKLTSHLKLLNETFNIHYFIIYSLHSLLNDDELYDFYRFTFLRKYDILSIEPRQVTPLECEKQYIIDAELCSVF